MKFEKYFYFLVLSFLFIYYPIETIMHGIQYDILIHSYILLALLTSIIFFIILLNKNKILRIIRYSYCTLSIIIMILIINIFYIFFNIADYIPYQDLYIYIFYFLSFNIIGLYLGVEINYLLGLVKKNIKYINYIFLMFTFIYMYLLLKSWNFNLNYIFLGFGNKIPHAGIHLTVSAFIAIWGILLITMNEKYKLFYFTLAFVMLFILGSRTSVLFFTIIGLGIIIIKTKLSKTLVFFIVLVCVIIINWDTIVSFLIERPRMYNLFTFNFNDSSLVERELQLHKNMAVIKNFFFTGLLMSEYIVGGKGSYIHSYLSYLQNYGFVVFLCLNLLLIKIIYLIIKNLHTIKKDNFAIFMSGVFFYIMSEFVFSRSYLAYHLYTFLIIAEIYFTQLNLKGIIYEK